MSEKVINAPVPGRVLDIKVKPDDKVKRGDILLIVEAMKMQNKVLTPFNGLVQKVEVKVGQAVDTSDPLVVIEAD